MKAVATLMSGAASLGAILLICTLLLIAFDNGMPSGSFAWKLSVFVYLLGIALFSALNAVACKCYAKDKYFDAAMANSMSFIIIAELFLTGYLLNQQR